MTVATRPIPTPALPAPTSPARVEPAPPPPPRALLPVELLLSPLAGLMWLAHALVRRPSVLVAATLLAACYPSGDSDATSVNVTPADLCALLLVGAVTLRVIAGERPLSHKAWPPFAFVLLALAVSTVASQDPGRSVAGFIRYTELFVLVPVAVAAATRDRWDVAVVGGAAVGASLLEGVVGTIQAATGTGASYGGQDVRAVGTFGAADVISMSQVVGFGIVIALAIGLATRARTRLLMLAFAAALVVPMAFSLSRGSWIATAVAVVATTIAAGRKLALKAGVAMVAVGTILVGGFGIGSATLADRVSSIASAPDQSVSDRYGLWHAAIGMWADHPLVGVGLKNFPLFRDSHAPLSVSSGSDIASASLAFQREPLLSPHNLYLLVLGEQGLIGICAFGVLFVALFTAAVRHRGRLVWARTVENRVLDLAAPGVVVWTLTSFIYGDIGGPSSVFVATLLGLVVRRGLAQPFAPTAPAWPAVLHPREPRTPRAKINRDALGTAALLSAVLAAGGMALGLLRDLLLATYFGADGGTDAFLVAWTVPETAAPLLIEGAMAYLMVPLFSRALTRGEPLREVLRGTLPRLGLLLAALAVATFATAPWLVEGLAPGLADPSLAVSSTRIVSVTVLGFGLAGYLSAALRASRVFAWPAAIYLAYNVAIVGSMLVLHGRLGIRSAAVGVAVGSVLMVAIQLPALLRRLGARGPRLPVAASITLAAVAPVAVFTVVRQAQVLIERYVGSELAPGTISHLNYAQKVGQVPMTLALVLTAVTFPALARTMAAGDENGSLRRVHADLRTVSTVVLLASAYLWAYAPQAVALLFQHGEYTAADTAATAAILRIYLFGLLGHAFVGVLSRPFFSGERPTWFPAAAMVGGLVLNAILAVLLAGPFGARGIAASNAAGILLAALLLLIGARRTVPGLVTGGVLLEAGRLVVPAVAAAGAGLVVARLVPGDLAPAVLGALVVPAAFAAVAAITVPAGVRAVAALIPGRSTS